MRVHLTTGQNIANPTAQILSGALMLDWLGQRHDVPAAIDAARHIDTAVDAVLATGYLTADAGGSTATSDFVARVATAVANQTGEASAQCS